MDIIENQLVVDLINSYPKKARNRLLDLRKLIFKTARKIESQYPLQETLKWGEPSYLTKNGSTLRMDWKESTTDQYALYFNCKSKIVDTIKEIYGELFEYQGNRAVILPLNKKLPVSVVRHCIQFALTYHKVKHLPLLGG